MGDAIPVITYFNVRGRAEVIRLLLEEVGVEYRERRVAVEEWSALKATLPFGQLPCLRSRPAAHLSEPCDLSKVVHVSLRTWPRRGGRRL
jgi:hypothetical protein